ncbi:hypothetical protein [Dactylosporangium sp. CA-139066]|uniref:hypothetical protein n=1 Tax=Dactylosporangium sp. CA-139066 TaxID=3239930 RepID=UPI003D8CF038
MGTHDRHGELSVVELERREPGLQVVARWEGGDLVDAPPPGPREVLIRITDDAAPEARRRGVTSGVMRRAERHLADLTAEYNAVPAVGAYQVMIRQYLQRRLAELPADPRSGGDAYYRGLLDLYEDIVGRGHPEPVNALAVAMGVPKETVKTRLRVARQRRTGG